MEIKSPYVLEPTPKTRLSIVVYLDVLGVTELIRESFTKASSAKLLKDLHNAYDKAIKHLVDRSAKERAGYRLWDIKAFTDNIVIGFPISEDGEWEMGSTFFNLTLFQLEMVLAGFFVRGVLSIGQHYMDSELVFGDAVLEAYDLEQTVARDPRIVLSPSATKYLKHHLTYYGDIKWSPQYRDVLKDADGQLFLNYLDVLANDENIDYEALEKHRDVIITRLNEFSGNPKIWSKYSWVANYHNYFCEQFKFLPTSLKVDISFFEIKPQRIDS